MSKWGCRGVTARKGLRPRASCNPRSYLSLGWALRRGISTGAPGSGAVGLRWLFAVRTTSRVVALIRQTLMSLHSILEVIKDPLEASTRISPLHAPKLGSPSMSPLLYRIFPGVSTTDSSGSEFLIISREEAWSCRLWASINNGERTTRGKRNETIFR